MFLIWRHKQVFAKILGCMPFDEAELQRISIFKYRTAFSLGLFFGSLHKLSEACNQAADAFDRFADAWKKTGLDPEDMEIE